MPAKRIVFLSRAPVTGFYRYVLRADVPAGNQLAYRNPAAVSAYDNATPAELQEVRDGLVKEKVGELAFTAPVTSIQTWLETRWNEWQAEVTGEASWADYGRHWTSGASWVASAGVPMAAGCETVPEGVPSYVALTPVSAYAASKFHFVLHHGMSTALAQGLVVKIRLVSILPGLVAVTGVAPSAWTLRRREAPTTPPSGAGSVSVGLMDSAFVLPTGIGAWNAPAVSPAGGTTTVINEFVPQADEMKLSTADASTLGATITPFGGQIVYSASGLAPARPLSLRAGQVLEVQQSATAGTGNCRVLCVFTVG